MIIINYLVFVPFKTVYYTLENNNKLLLVILLVNNNKYKLEIIIGIFK